MCLSGKSSSARSLKCLICGNFSEKYIWVMNYGIDCHQSCPWFSNFICGNKMSLKPSKGFVNAENNCKKRWFLFLWLRNILISWPFYIRMSVVTALDLVFQILKLTEWMTSVLECLQTDHIFTNLHVNLCYCMVLSEKEEAWGAFFFFKWLSCSSEQKQNFKLHGRVWCLTLKVVYQFIVLLFSYWNSNGSSLEGNL